MGILRSIAETMAEARAEEEARKQAARKRQQESRDRRVVLAYEDFLKRHNLTASEDIREAFYAGLDCGYDEGRIMVREILR